jgi:hypothetical protein
LPLYNPKPVARCGCQAQECKLIDHSFMILLALFVPFIYFCFPETAQLSLEEVDSRSSIYLYSHLYRG